MGENMKIKRIVILILTCAALAGATLALHGCGGGYGPGVEIIGTTS